jgi:hypothetical protein
MIITEQIFTIDSTISRIFSTLIRGLDRDEGRVVELEEEEENKNGTTCQYRRETAPVRVCPMAAAAAASEGRKRVMTLSGPPCYTAPIQNFSIPFSVLFEPPKPARQAVSR